MGKTLPVIAPSAKGYTTSTRYKYDFMYQTDAFGHEKPGLFVFLEFSLPQAKV
jgi:hypothetical protein